MNIKRLNELAVGDSGTVASIVSEGSMRRRFLDVGIVPGTEVTCVGRSPFGDPSAYLVRGTKIAIRKIDAHGIVLK